MPTKPKTEHNRISRRKNYPIKELKTIADDVAVENYGDFYRSVSKRNRAWLDKNYGRP